MIVGSFIFQSVLRAKHRLKSL